MEDRFVPEGDLCVLDRETGLMWQKEASAARMVWKQGPDYIETLNGQQFGGFSDWRYPKKEELQSLILSEEDRRTGLYIDPAFGTQRNCWSSTQGEHHQACYADFYYGDLYLVEENYANHFIRAVRTRTEN